MYFLMTPERNSSFAITSHLYNYIKYKYNICIMTLYNYIYMYLYLRVYIYMCDYLRVCTSRLRSFVNSYGKSQFLIGMFCQRARLHGCQT
jgi:hypothetical protein